MFLGPSSGIKPKHPTGEPLYSPLKKSLKSKFFDIFNIILDNIIFDYIIQQYF